LGGRGKEREESALQNANKLKIHIWRALYNHRGSRSDAKFASAVSAMSGSQRS